MPSHPYLRAYMAGVVLPSVVVCLAGVAVATAFSRIPPDIERAMIFPMAINPAIWGLWNILYVRLQGRYYLPIGWYGTVLCLVLIASGVVLARALSITFVTVRGAALVGPPMIAAYYVLWRYGVRFLNNIAGISDAAPFASTRHP